MLQSINIDEIRQYNTSLKQYRDRAASLNAEIEYTNKEIDAICSELSAELGVNVTRDNIEQIYNEQLEKINSTLQSGNAVLAKIASEESAAQTTVVTATNEQASMGFATPAPVFVQTQPQETPVAPVFAQPQVGGTALPPFFS